MEACDICSFSVDDQPLYGEMLKGTSLRMHYLCLLSSDIPQRARTVGIFKGFLVQDIQSQLPTIQATKCYICSEMSAAVTCKHKGCDRKWHYKCGRENNCITQFIGAFNSYCDKHVPDTNLYKHPDPIWCLVCYELIEKYHPANSLISKCCLENHLHVKEVTLEDMQLTSVMHAECVQRYASNAGYSTRCIACIMTSMTNEEYQNQMRLKGIYVPMQEAEWEKDNYFKKMVKNKCGNAACPMPKETLTVYTCVVCGCFPLHLSCAKVKTVDEYYCPGCIDQSFVVRVPFTSRYDKAHCSTSKDA